MDLYKVIDRLIEERNRIDQVIRTLEGRSRGVFAGAGRKTTEATRPRSRRGRKSMDAAARQEVSERMKKYWARRRSDSAKQKPQVA